MNPAYLQDKNIKKYFFSEIDGRLLRRMLQSVGAASGRGYGRSAARHKKDGKGEGPGQ